MDSNLKLKLIMVVEKLANNKEDSTFVGNYKNGFNAAVELLLPCVEASKYRCACDEECGDSDEDFGPNETCECGAVALRQTIVNLDAKLKRVIENENKKN